MHLAKAFGAPDVDRFLAGLTVGQVLEWFEFFALESAELGAAGGEGGEQRARRGPMVRDPKQMECILRASVGPQRNTGG